MMRRVQLLLAALGMAWLVLSCSEPSRPPSAGSNSNWLRSCASDVECGTAGACRCGLCTLSCDDDAACVELPEATCAKQSGGSLPSQCRDEPVTSGICLQACSAGSCGASRACVGGACVDFPLQQSAFCDPVTQGALGSSSAEDELLDALQARRAAGGVPCSGGGVSAALPALRLDARLACAARVFAKDIVDSGTSSLIDSAGRGTVDRLAAAGYAPQNQYETFLVSQGAPDEVITTMLQSTRECQGLASPEFDDVGVASFGDVRVVVVARP